MATIQSISYDSVLSKSYDIVTDELEKNTIYISEDFPKITKLIFTTIISRS